MKIEEMELEDNFEKYDLITENLKSTLGLGIFMIPKNCIIYTAKGFNEFYAPGIEACYEAIKEYDSNEIMYISSYESGNFFIIKKGEYQQLTTSVGKTDDARDFFYNTVSIDIPKVEEDSILLFRLNH